MSSKQSTLLNAWNKKAKNTEKKFTAKDVIDITQESGDDLMDDDDDLDLLEAAEALEKSECNEGPSTSAYNYNAPAAIEDVPGFDNSAGNIWIYPQNYPVRSYQFSMTKSALFRNTLICLPTGLGKTHIAAVVMYNFYRWYPEGKIIFMAPTKPLVSQQIEACYKVMGIPRDDTAQITGMTMSADKRSNLWKQKRVFFVTPQVVNNDLARGSFSAEKVKCLVFDEAHKAQGKYAYCQVIQQMQSQTRNFRVLALSATPGTDVKAVQQVITNLLISNIEMRCEDSIDIQQYSHQRVVEKIIVKLDASILQLKEKFLELVKTFLRTLEKFRVTMDSDPTRYTKYGLLMSRDQYRKDPPSGLSKYEMGSIEGDFAILITLYHALELLQLHGMRSFFIHLKSTVEGDKGTQRAKSVLGANKIFREIYGELTNMFGADPSSNVQSTQATQRQSASTQRPYVYSHPKVKKMEELVVKHFQDFNKDVKKLESGASTRVMIFSQYRDSVQEITELLQKHRPLIRPMQFIGHSTASGKVGKFTQKDQLKVVDKFRSAGYNVLVSTCVGEEGLDIGDVDLIVCFDSHKSPIRLVQRMGRTGRKRKGKIVMLVTEGKEEKDYNSSVYSRKSINKAIMNAKGKSLQFYPHNPAMIPKGLNPQPHMMHMDVKQSLPTAVPSKEKGKTTTLKSSDKRKSKDISVLFSKANECAEQNSVFLNKEQLEVLNTSSTTSSRNVENIKRLFEKNFIILNKDKKIFNDSSNLLLNRWPSWQTHKQKCHLVDHSTMTSVFVDIMEMCDFIKQGEDGTQADKPKTQKPVKKQKSKNSPVEEQPKINVSKSSNVNFKDRLNLFKCNDELMQVVPTVENNPSGNDKDKVFHEKEKVDNIPGEVVDLTSDDEEVSLQPVNVKNKKKLGSNSSKPNENNFWEKSNDKLENKTLIKTTATEKYPSNNNDFNVLNKDSDADINVELNSQKNKTKNILKIDCFQNASNSDITDKAFDFINDLSPIVPQSEKKCSVMISTKPLRIPTPPFIEDENFSLEFLNDFEDPLESDKDNVAIKNRKCFQLNSKNNESIDHDAGINDQKITKCNKSKVTSKSGNDNKLDNKLCQNLKQDKHHEECLEKQEGEEIQNTFAFPDEDDFNWSEMDFSLTENNKNINEVNQTSPKIKLAPEKDNNEALYIGEENKDDEIHKAVKTNEYCFKNTNNITDSTELKSGFGNLKREEIDLSGMDLCQDTPDVNDTEVDNSSPIDLPSTSKVLVDEGKISDKEVAKKMIKLNEEDQKVNDEFVDSSLDLFGPDLEANFDLGEDFFDDVKTVPEKDDKKENDDIKKAEQTITQISENRLLFADLPKKKTADYTKKVSAVLPLSANKKKESPVASDKYSTLIDRCRQKRQLSPDDDFVPAGKFKKFKPDVASVIPKKVVNVSHVTESNEIPDVLSQICLKRSPSRRKFCIGSDSDYSPSPKNISKKRNKRMKRQEFIDDEAEVSVDGMHLSSDETEEDLNGSLLDFVNDASQLTQHHEGTHIDEDALYLQSVRSPHKQGVLFNQSPAFKVGRSKFKMSHKVRPDVEIFSQEVSPDRSDYDDNDSFVNNDEIEFEDDNNDNTNEITLLNNISETDNVRRTRRQTKLKEINKWKEKTPKPVKRKRIMMLEESTDAEVSYSTHGKSNSKGLSRTPCTNINNTDDKTVQNKTESKPELKPGEWKCEACTLINKPSSQVCELCDSQKSGVEVMAVTTWICQNCTFESSTSSDVCFMCDRKRNDNNNNHNNNEKYQNLKCIKNNIPIQNSTTEHTPKTVTNSMDQLNETPTVKHSNTTCINNKKTNTPSKNKHSPPTPKSPVIISSTPLAKRRLSLHDRTKASDRDERLRRCREKQAELRQKLAKRKAQSLFESNIASPIQPCSSKSLDVQSPLHFDGKKPQSHPSSGPIRKQSNTTNASSSRHIASKTSGLPVIIISCKELSSAHDVATTLRSQRLAHIVVASLNLCDYAVGISTVVDRMLVSELGSSINKKKIVQRFQKLTLSFTKVYLILEQDRVKRGELGSISTAAKSTYINSLLCSIIGANIKVLHSSSPEESAKILHALANRELVADSGIPKEVADCATNPAYKTYIKLYMSMPRVTLITALFMCYQFKSYKQVACSSVEKLMQTAHMKPCVAVEVYNYFRKKFDPEMIAKEL